MREVIEHNELIRVKVDVFVLVNHSTISDRKRKSKSPAH